MAEFGIDVDPGEAGLDARWLQRIDTHFRRYVDDGRLAGWQVMVSRHGKVAHLTSYGLADKEAGRPVETDTLWRIFSMTKAVTSVAAMMLWEEGAFELQTQVLDPGRRFTEGSSVAEALGHCRCLPSCGR